MSGHSKWATTHRQKEVADAKRGKIFTRLAKAITLAAKQGGGVPENNFQLRLAIDRAKATNMPKENIDRAIKRGTGELAGEQIEEIVYEGFGPGGTAWLVEALTDNRNRTVSNLKHFFNKYGGNLGSTGSVAWMFDQRGVIRILASELTNKNLEDLELKLIDLGASDVNHEPEGLVVYTEPINLQKIKGAIEQLGLKIVDAEVEYLPKNKITVTEAEAKEKLKNLINELEEDEDVNNYYYNFND